MGEMPFDNDIKWDELAEEFPLPPAYLKEGLNRVALYSLAREDGKKVNHDDIRGALLNMMNHKKLEEQGNAGDNIRTIEMSISEIVDEQVAEVKENVEKIIDHINQ